MKSKLTLRIRSDVKARAKAIAAERGTSVSNLVETYFQLLDQKKLERQTPGDEEPMRSARATPKADAAGGDASGSELSPRIQALQAALGEPAPPVDPDEDTRRWGEHGAKKHA